MLGVRARIVGFGTARRASHTLIRLRVLVLSQSQAIWSHQFGETRLSPAPKMPHTQNVNIRIVSQPD